MFRKGLYSLIVLGLIFFIVACQKTSSFTVSFNSNGGSDVADITFKKDENFSLPSNPNREGYTFDGWFFDQNVFNEPVTPAVILEKEFKEEMTVYAKWNLINYTLTYVLNEGINHQDNPETFNVEDTYVISDPSKTGFVFDGWFSNAELTETFNLSDIALENQTLYAKWTALEYTVTWKNYDQVVLETDTLSYGETPTYDGVLPTRPNSETEIYTFTGWNPVVDKVTSDITYVATYSSETINTKNPFDATELNAVFGFDIYQTMPGFVTSDVLVVDVSEGTIKEVYIDIFDWTEADADAYIALLDASYTWDELEESWILGDYFIYIYAEDEEYPGKIVYGIGIYGDSSSGEDPETPFDVSKLNTIFGFDIYQTMPSFESEDAILLDYSEGTTKEVYIDIFDWTETDADVYVALLDASYTWDDVEESWVLGDYFIYVYADDQTYENLVVYGIGIYSGEESGNTETPYNPDELNTIFGFDIYKTIPSFESEDALLVNYSEPGYKEVYIDIFDWTETDADAYIASLDASYTWDDVEESWVLGNYYIYVYADDQAYEGQIVYGIGIYGLDEGSVEPVEGLYYSFNIQDTTTSLTSSYKENVDVVLNFTGSEDKANIKASFIANIVDTPPTGLTNGVIFASNVKDNPQALAYLEIDTLGHMIDSIVFEIEVRDSFSEKLLGAKLQVFDGTTWVDYAQGDFYQQLSSDQVLITISGFQSSHFRLIFTGAGLTSNGGQFKISQVNLFQSEEVTIYPTWTDMMNVLKTELNSSGLDTVLPELENLSSIQLEKVGNKSYIVSGLFAYPNYSELVSAYVNEIITQGYILNQELSTIYSRDVYILIISDDLAYAISISSDGEIASVFFFQYDPVIDVIELNSLSKQQSINEYEKATFGKSGLPSTGAYDVLVVPIEISSHPFPSNYKSQIELTFNGTSEQTGWESVSSFYKKSSYGLLDLNFVVLDKYTTANPNTYYEGIADRGGDQYAIKEALLALDPTINFSNYDSNQDGVIDSIVFIFSMQYNYDVDPWWAWVYAAKHGEAANSTFDNVSFEYYMWASYYFLEDDLPGGYNPSTNAETYIHELGHLMGLIDYYSFTLDYGPTGGFDMMDYNAGDHGPASKVILGWLQPMIAVEGTYEVSLEAYALDTDGLGSAIVIPYNSSDLADGNAFDEYIIIMYYTPEGLYDAHLDASYVLDQAGLVIYHVDARLYERSDFWENYFLYNNDGDSDFFLEILEADKNNSIPGNTTFSLSDMLVSGQLDLSSYTWHQGGSMNVSIELLSPVSTSSQISFILSVN